MSSYRGRHRRRSLRGVVSAVLASASLAVALAGTGAYGGYLARITNANNTAATNPYFTCTSAVQNLGANGYFAYPFSDANNSLTAADVSAGTPAQTSRNGAYSTVLNAGLVPTGITYGQSNGGVCPRDNKTVITLDGTAGYVSGPAAAIPSPGPNSFTVAVWFKTTVKQGKLIGYGSSRTGASGSYDRHIYINTSGNLVFGVYSNNTVKLVTSPAVVTDGAWHQAVATLSSAGMVLYLDGVSTGTPDPTTTTGQPFPGYWRIGYDTLNDGWTGAGPNFYFKGQLAFAAAYPTAITAAQVTAQYRAGR